MAEAVARVRLGPVENPVRGLLDTSGALLAIAVVGPFWAAEPGASPVRLGLGVLVATHLALFVVSGLYHSVPWSRPWKRRMQRLDHSMIFLKIAGSVTSLALVAPGPVPGVAALLAGVWIIGAGGMVQKLWFPGVHERASIPFQILQAALALPLLVALPARPPDAMAGLALAVGALYAAGALVFVTERPRLWPRVFSFHDLFHLLILAGNALFYVLLLECAAAAG